jgi:hypothetical protein
MYAPSIALIIHGWARYRGLRAAIYVQGVASQQLQRGPFIRGGRCKYAKSSNRSRLGSASRGVTVDCGGKYMGDGAIAPNKNN